MDKKETMIIAQQTLLDIAIQQCGSAKAIVDIAVLNNLSITDTLETGQVVKSDKVIDVNIADYYRNRNLKPVTGLNDEDKIIIAKEEGIAYWGINVDFVVQ